MSDFPTPQDEQDQLNAEWAHQQALDAERDALEKEEQNDYIKWRVANEIHALVRYIGKENAQEFLQEICKNLK